MGPVVEEVAGWGRHPVGRGRVERPEHLALPADGEPLVPRGLGRAYGDAALPARPGGLVLESTRADRIRSFEPATGRLHCEAGLSLAEILRVFVPRGWFPPVTPGTKFVTVGACVACDVHGKNHHRDGSFGNFVDRVTLCTADGRLVECGPDRERELILATLGGMGLTGLIVDVTLRLRRVQSPWIVLETQGMASLDAMLEGLRLSATHWPYTVGWIDCLARGRDLGRGILMRGRHASIPVAPDTTAKSVKVAPSSDDATRTLVRCKLGSGGSQAVAITQSLPPSTKSLGWRRSRGAELRMALVDQLRPLSPEYIT